MDSAGPPDSLDDRTSADQAPSWFADPEAILRAMRSAPPAGATPSIDGIDLVHEIARGGQGVVFLAVQRSTRRQVAVKLLVERGYATATARRRFEREIELLASIDHPGIVRVFDSGVTREGLLYLVMEFVEGVPLDRFLAPLPASPERAVGLLAEVADAVHAAHRRGVLHRDLKPSNILVDRDGRPRIVDFGLARAMEPAAGDPAVSVTGQFVGSLPWASPEHAAGRPELVDVRSDVYSLGVILFQVITGRFPYPVDGSLAATLKAITETPASRVASIRRDVHRDLDAVVQACLAKSADQRYATAADLSADLRAVLGGAPIRARRDSAWEGMARRLRRSRQIAAVSTVAAVVVCILAAVAWRSSQVAEVERARAERRFDEARRLARAFLFDFHEAITPLAGSRPAREKLVSTALDYLTGLEHEVGDDPQFRADLAAAYERVADIQGNPTMPNLGQTPAAIASLRKAAALREANLATSPDDPVALRSAARGLDLIGYLEAQIGKERDGLATLAAGMRLLERARTFAPADALLLREFAANCDRASTIHASIGATDESLADLDRGIEALRSLPAGEASQRDALEVLLYKKAFTLRQAKRLDEALAAGQATLDLTRAIAADAPNDALRRRALSVNLNDLALTQIALGRLDDAAASLDESVGIARALRDAEPANPTTINDLAYALARYAQLEQERGRFDAALERFDEVKALRSEASGRDPANAVIRRGVAIASAMAAGAAEAAAGDARTPVERRSAYLERAAAAFDDARARLEAMRTDGVLLEGDGAAIQEMIDGAARVRTAAGAAQTK